MSSTGSEAQLAKHQRPSLIVIGGATSRQVKEQLYIAIDVAVPDDHMHAA